MKKIAFTLAETVIVLVVIGVLAIIILSTLSGMQPDKEKVLFKKAYEVAERTVGELVNDESIYPYDASRIGFYNTDLAEIDSMSEGYGGVEGEADEANKRADKFRQFFARKLNSYADPNWMLARDDEGFACHFQTTDGICWYIPKAFDDPEDASGRRISILVDINGNEEPNTFENVHQRDRYTIFVDYDGRLRVPSGSDNKEIEFLRSHKAIKQKGE